jgi:hypothetical protein
VCDQGDIRSQNIKINLNPHASSPSLLRIQQGYGENKVEVLTQHQVASIEGYARITSLKALDKAQVESAGIEKRGTEGNEG